MSTMLAQSLKDHLIGGAIMFALFAVPILGCVLSVIYNSAWPLLLLLPLFAFMEAGLFLVALALFIVAGINGW